MHRVYWILTITLLLSTPLAFSKSINKTRSEWAKRLQAEMHYLNERAENPKVYKGSYKKRIARSRNSKDILNLEEAFGDQDSISTSLAAPKRKTQAKKKFVPRKRQR